MMKTRTFKTSVLSTACLLLFAGSAMAYPVAGDSVKVRTDLGLGHNDGGGEFYLDLYNDGSFDYVTFCVEKNEFINNGVVYKIDSVEDNVYNGGVTGGSPDPLSYITEWVYYKYTQTTYFGTHTADLANQIQQIIWKEEGEITSYSYTGTQALYDTMVAGKATNEYDLYVDAINLSKDCVKKQTLLVSTPVPEPTVTMLFALGAVGFAGMARRRMNR